MPFCTFHNDSIEYNNHILAFPISSRNPCTTPMVRPCFTSALNHSLSLFDSELRIAQVPRIKINIGVPNISKNIATAIIDATIVPNGSGML